MNGVLVVGAVYQDRPLYSANIHPPPRILPGKGGGRGGQLDSGRSLMSAFPSSQTHPGLVQLYLSGSDQPTDHRL